MSLHHERVDAAPPASRLCWDRGQWQDPTRTGLPLGDLRTNCGTCKVLFPHEPLLWIGHRASSFQCPNHCWHKEKNPPTAAPVDARNVAPLDAPNVAPLDGRAPALGFRDVEPHHLDSKGKVSQAVGREAWRNLDAGPPLA